MILKRAASARIAAVLLAASAMLPAPALAQLTGYQVTDPITGAQVIQPDSVATPHPINCVTGCSGSASLTPFTPDNNSLISPSATTSSSPSALALGSGSGATVKFTDTGSVAEHYRLCPTSSCVATTSDDRVNPGIANYVSRGSNLYIAFITDSGSTTNDVVTGAGGLDATVNSNVNANPTIANLPAAADAGAGAPSASTIRTVAASGSNLATSQVSCGSTATSALSSRGARLLVSATNTTTTSIYVGPSSGVTTSNGQLLAGIVGASLTFPTTSALYCIVASGTATITLTEIY